MRHGVHLPQVCAWHNFRNDAAISTGQSPGGLAMMRLSRSLYSISTVVWAWLGVMMLNLLNWFDLPC